MWRILEDVNYVRWEDWTGLLWLRKMEKWGLMWK
jgi:hypothetical protein